VVLEVPVGTVAVDDLTGETIGELTEPGQRLLVVPGGQGGLGNWHFRTATNQTPEHAQPGTPGQERQVVLELKLLADVGLVGFPNAGKSTLLSVLTSARPEIADYPFTTLQPNLGIVRYHDYQSFVMADIPGIIEGAAEGRGLGLTFLRHIERNSALLFLVPADTDDIRGQYHILLHELEKYTPELLDTPRLLGISKTDLIDAEIQEALQAELHDLNPVFFSAAAETQLDTLKDRLWQLLNPPDEW
jgi:GTP-binding protein